MKKSIPVILFLTACGPGDITPPDPVVSPSPTEAKITQVYPIVYTTSPVDKYCVLISMGLDVNDSESLDVGETVHNVLICPTTHSEHKGRGRGHGRK